MASQWMTMERRPSTGFDDFLKVNLRTERKPQPEPQPQPIKSKPQPSIQRRTDRNGFEDFLEVGETMADCYCPSDEETLDAVLDDCLESDADFGYDGITASEYGTPVYTLPSRRNAETKRAEQTYMLFTPQRRAVMTPPTLGREYGTPSCVYRPTSRSQDSVYDDRSPSRRKKVSSRGSRQRTKSPEKISLFEVESPTIPEDVDHQDSPQSQQREVSPRRLRRYNTFEGDTTPSRRQDLTKNIARRVNPSVSPSPRSKMADGENVVATDRRKNEVHDDKTWCMPSLTGKRLMAPIEEETVEKLQTMRDGRIRRITIVTRLEKFEDDPIYWQLRARK